MPRTAVRILPFRDEHPPGAELGAQLNLGPKSAAWLHEIGLRNLDDVRRLGPIEVCRQLRHQGRPVSVVMAYALEGALSGTQWNALPGETKLALREDFARMKRAASPKSGRARPARRPRAASGVAVAKDENLWGQR